jgi:DNA excision repair protein ERCC-2
MRFDLDGLDVFFPYDRMYLEQHQYMRALKQSLDAGGHCLLEMPTGTGKTVCLLSLITSYQYANPSAGKLVYATRTVPEMNHVMQELAVVMNYRAQELRKQTINNSNEQEDPNSNSTTNKKSKRSILGPSSDPGGAGGSGALALCLSSRRNLCVNNHVMAESDREAVDAACRQRTASWVLEASKTNSSIETCSYFDTFLQAGESTTMPSGVYDLQELQVWGKQQGWCPYYLTRQALNHANILVFNYQYMLDPKVAKMVSKELESESIIVFDEAHNIDSVCIEALSVTINDRGLEQATRSLGRLVGEVARQKASDSRRLQTEYQNLVNGLIDQGLLDAPANDQGLGSVRICV